MRVTIHGPNLTDQSEGSFRVHAEDSPENEHEVKLNGSQHPDTLDVASREALVDYVYPAEQYDRAPGDLKLYLSDIHFGSSLDELPIAEDNHNEGEDSMAYTAEEKSQALEIYKGSTSYRRVGKEMGISPSKAKKIVEEALEVEQTKAAEAAETAAAEGRAPAQVDATKVATCRHCKVEKPMTTEHWYVKKSTGELYTSSRCKTCESDYRKARKAEKAQPETPVAVAA